MAGTGVLRDVLKNEASFAGLILLAGGRIRYRPDGTPVLDFGGGGDTGAGSGIPMHGSEHGLLGGDPVLLDAAQIVSGALAKARQHAQTGYKDEANNWPLLQRVGSQTAGTGLVVGSQSGALSPSSLTNDVGVTVYADFNSVAEAITAANQHTGTSAGVGWQALLATSTGVLKRAGSVRVAKAGTWDNATASTQDAQMVFRVALDGTNTDAMTLTPLLLSLVGDLSILRTGANGQITLQRVSGAGIGMQTQAALAHIYSIGGFALRLGTNSTGRAEVRDASFGPLASGYDLGTSALPFRDLYLAAVLRSTQATGTAPMVIASTTMVSNLNVELLGGQNSAYHLALANASGILAAAKGGTGADGSALAINRVLASPGSGGAGAASYRALVEADIPHIFTGAFQVEDLTITASFESQGGGLFDAAVVFNEAVTFENDDGILLPRLTTTQRDDILGPANGLVLYNSTTGKFQGRAAGAWVDFH